MVMPFFGYTQEIYSFEKIDSLKVLLNKAESDFQIAETNLELSRAYLGVDSVLTFQYSQTALNFFLKNKDLLGQAKANHAIGKSTFYYGNPEIAENYYKKTIEALEKLMVKDSTNELVQLYLDSNFNLASSYTNQGKEDLQFEVYLKIEPIAKRIKDYKTLALINTSIGISYYNRQESEKAYSYLLNSPEIYDKIDLKEYYVQDRLVFAACLRSMDSLPKMKSVLNETEVILNTIEESAPWHVYYRIKGEYLTDIEDFDGALAIYDLCRAFIQEKKIKGFLPGLLLNYSETFENDGNIKMAKQHLYELYDLDESLALGKLLGIKEISRLEELEGNFERSLQYLKEYNHLNDSINSSKINQKAVQLEQLYQKEKRDREIVELKSKNYETDLNLEREKLRNYLLFFVTGSLLLLSVSGYLTYRNRQKRAQLKQQQQEQEIQSLKSEKERNLFGVMMEGVEQERKRLAADLHDGLGGRLSGISIKLSKLAEVEKVKKVAPELNDILDNIDDSLQELRGVARNLMPETLLKYGLKAALEDYCSTLKYKGTDITLQYYGNEEIKNQATKLTVYRIIQELINNSLKHAKATEILVQFIHEKGKIDITVEDDGVGFDQLKPDKENGLGLTNLKNRVNYLNGKMDIHSIVNEGTSINIQISAA